MWLAYTPALVSPSQGTHGDMPCAFLQQGMVLNGSFFLILVPYSVYYMALDIVAGVSWLLFVGIPLWITSELFQQYFFETAWIWALAVHLFSWLVQIVAGHMYFERRKPALMDSLFQSLLLAPLFVWFELLFLLGYRRDLYEDISAAIHEEIVLLTDENEEKKRGTNEETLVE